MPEPTAEELLLKVDSMSNRLVWLHNSLANVFPVIGKLACKEITVKQAIKEFKTLENQIRES